MPDHSATIDHWDSDPWNTDEIVFWLQHPKVQQRLALKESGRPDGNWIAHTLQTWLPDATPVERCLSLGCGRGRIERDLAARQAFVTCDAFDLSAESIADASHAALAAGFTHINYAVADIDHIQLAPGRYDVVWIVSAAHHFSRLEHVFAQVAQALKPDGLVVLYEYVGANRFQFPARQRQVIEACLQLLPMSYRLLPAPALSATGGAIADAARPRRKKAAWVARRVLDKVREGTLLSTAQRLWRKQQALHSGQRPVKEIAVPTERSVIAVDPSEAIRADEIVSILETQFDILENRPLGGSILQFLLADIAGNFQDAAGEQWLDILFQIEDALLASGDLTSDFACIVAKPKHHLV